MKPLAALRGINLGGWLVAERWMTPHLFEGVKGEGEIALVRELGYETAKKRLSAHRSSFITEKDFKWIAGQGFDFVRLPVGYWLFEETDDFIDGETHLRQAFAWATLHDVGIILDFHGLQGSQNGQDHSGQVGKVRLYRPQNRADALRTLEYICQTYGQHPRLLALEVINEPKARWFLWRVLRYYDRAIPIAERYLAPGVKIIVSDAFKPLRMARALSRRGYDMRRLVLDVHLYQVFTKNDRRRSYDQHLQTVRYDWLHLLDRLGRYLPIIVGEWSAALPAAAYRTQPDSETDGMRGYYESQYKIFAEHSWAHSYWSYKAPGAGAWDYRTSLSTHR